ncbi:hypothetical protein L1987_33142 [Smallanthus sonchifolius]|uniref:Uncharacterized protein n=1 Tax=Smallanthus sonchifolius TaxID=185202 RepID=A0ACB9HR21_9ASTR|nr:hypothetical protein L1987_33142 [Smallanthus sonchifolius]
MRLQNYEFESKGFVDTSASKPVRAALIAPMVENIFPVYHAPTVQSSCSKCTGCHFAKECHAPKTFNNFKANSKSSSQSTAPASKAAALVSQQTTTTSDPILSTSKLEEEIGSEDERAENFNKENISFHVDTKISDESKKVESKGSFSSQNVKPGLEKKKTWFYVRNASHHKSQQFSKSTNSQYTPKSHERNDHQNCCHTSSSKMNQRSVSPRKLKACYICHDLYHIAYDYLAVSEVNEVEVIKATINGQEVLISEGIIRTHLRFGDAASDPTTLSPDVGLKFFLVDGKAKKFLAYPRCLQHIFHEEIPNLPELEETLDLPHLNPRVFINMKKNHSRSTFYGTETPLFPELLGFTDVESGAESSSSRSSSCNVDYDAVDNNDDGHNGEGYSTFSPNHDRIPTHIHRSSAHSHEEVMHSWAITLQTKNESLQKAVAELTSLFSSLSTTVQSQDKEILKLKKENKRLKLAKSSSKPKKFKILVRGPPPKPSYKNFVVSSSTSFEDDAVRQGEKDSDEEIFYDVDKGKHIGTEVESQVTSKAKLSKEMDEELSRKAIAELLRQNELEAKTQADVETTKAAALS